MDTSQTTVEATNGISCKIVADSTSPCGKRLTTIEARYPRFIHSEIMTHRDRARNAASSRAIPWPKMMAAITEDPVIPIRFGSEQKGMQTGGEIETPELAKEIWLKARDNAVSSAQALAELGVHKSICNRITEPWMWITVVMTATEWKNFFRLRCHPDAEIHFQELACKIRDALAISAPQRKCVGEWHLPYTVPSDFEYDIEIVKMASVARCARVSYLTHDGVPSVAKDVALFNKLVNGSGFGHWSPMEHVARALKSPMRSGPFVGWHQFRKEFPQENSEG